MLCFYFSLFLAFGVAHQAVEEVSPSGDTILVQGDYYICTQHLIVKMYGKCVVLSKPSDYKSLWVTILI